MSRFSLTTSRLARLAPPLLVLLALAVGAGGAPPTQMHDTRADGASEAQGPTQSDPDGDGFGVDDNCPDVANASQADRDADGLGDACDPYDAAQECVGSGWQPGPLPVVTATCQRDGSPACTAEDLNLALLECSRLGGCILQLLATTYSGVAINIYNGDRGRAPHGCQPEMSHCLTAKFPKGLVIQGHGSRSVLQAKVFSGNDRPYPVLRLYRRPDIHLRMRNLTLDGIKERQDSLTLPERAWHHTGFEISNYFTRQPRSASGCIHNTVAQNFMSKAIDISDVENWIFEYNTVRDIGCHDTFTPCPGIADTVPAYPNTAGYRVPGYGIGPGTWSAGLIYRGNTLTRVTKYSLHFKGKSDGSYLIDGGVMTDNRITESGSRGIFIAGLKNGRIARNRIEKGNQFRVGGGFHNHDISAFSLAGRIEDSVFADNEVSDNAGPAVAYKAVGRGIVFSNTRISGGCRVRNPTTCNPPDGPEPGKCFNRGEIAIDRSGGDVRFENTTIVSSRCRFVLRTQPGVQTADIAVSGGTLEAGPLASPGPPSADGGAINVAGRGVLTLEGGVVLRNRGDPQLAGVVLSGKDSTAVVKDAVLEGFARDYEEARRDTGGFVFCARTPKDPRCR